MGNALALRGDEGRDKLRKAAGIGTYKLIRRYPNGQPSMLKTCYPKGGEPGELKHLSTRRRRKQK